MKKEIVKKILKETEIGYDMMSQKFSETRKFFWRGMEFIGNCAKDGDRVLDYGCGNGRLLELIGNRKIEYTGVDVSQKLIDLAKSKYTGAEATFSRIDPSQSSLAFENNYFNVVYSIAVFHHFPKSHAQKIAKELFRVTKPGGQVIVTVWNLWQKKYLKNIFENWRAKIIGKSELDWNDCHITFKNNQGETFHRFHHAFTMGELGKIFEKAGFQKQKLEKIGGRNLVFLGKK